MTRAEVRRVLGIDVRRDVTAAEAVALAGRDWEAFHVLLANEGYAAHSREEVVASWRRVLPQRTILLEDVGALAETIVSLIQVNEGADAADVAASWGGTAGRVVATALGAQPASKRSTGWWRRSASQPWRRGARFRLRYHGELT